MAEELRLRLRTKKRREAGFQLRGPDRSFQRLQVGRRGQATWSEAIYRPEAAQAALGEGK